MGRDVEEAGREVWKQDEGEEVGCGERKNLNTLSPHAQQQPGGKRILSPQGTVPEEMDPLLTCS